MKNAHLAFLLLAGLDFLRAAGTVLKLAQNRYCVETEREYIYYPFLNTQVTPGQAGPCHTGSEMPQPLSRG